MKATFIYTEKFDTNRKLANRALKAMSQICDADNGTIHNPYELASSVMKDGRTLIQTIYEDGKVMYNDGWYIVEVDDFQMYVALTGNKKKEDTVCFFNKDSNMTWDEWYRHNVYNISLDLKITEWVNFEDMTDEEKKGNPKAYVCGGYLKVYQYKEAWANLWKTLDEEQKNAFKTLPNYDPVIFEDITGIKFY